MAIAYSSQGAGNAVTTGDLTVSNPATVNANDILIIHGAFADTGAGTLSTPTGFTLLSGPNDYGVTPNGKHWLWGKIADGTEDGASNNLGNTGGVQKRWARVYSYTGYVSGTITDVVRGFSNHPHGTDPPGPTVTTTVADSLAIAAICQQDDNAYTSIAGETGGTWVESVAEYTATTGAGVMLAIEHATMASPGTISGGTGSTANDPCATLGFEIRTNPPPEIPEIVMPPLKSV